MLQARAQVASLFHIDPGAFNPPPKDDSAFVRLQPWETPPYEIDDWEVFSRVVAQAFSQGRKTLRNSLRQLLAEETIVAAGLEPGVRAEQLSVKDFATLSNLVVKNRRNP
jgi:16S rRNA (adenine1518-N6/adenine1519-N6)-dimethyltransferase